MLKKLMRTDGDVAPLLLRLTLAAVMFPHGAQKMLGTHEQGTIMPPAGVLSDTMIQIVLDWIEAGALND